MKVAVIGDTHLGASYALGKKDHATGRNTRLTDYQNTLQKTISNVVEEGCEILVFTGDIFEHRHPNALYQKIFSQHLHYALYSGIKEIHIVVGNHDQQRVGDATIISYLKELGLSNILVHDELSCHTVMKNGEPAVNLLFMPYRDKRWLDVGTYQQAIAKLDSQLKYQLSCIDNDAPKLLVGHMTLEGTFFADEYAELYSENELYLPKEMFKNIDVTIMGHVHSPYVISENPYIAYVGSMEKRGAFESHDKKYAIVDTRLKKVDYGVEPCRNIYDLKLHLADKVLGETFMDVLLKEIDEWAIGKDTKSAIIRPLISIAADDNKFCLNKQIEAYLKEKLDAQHVVMLKPQLVFSRQARDSQITEHSSDSESFVRYVKNTVDDKELSDRIMSYGLDIIKAGGGS